ncbi:MAG: hypothetical protein V5A50_05390 [Thiohalorhabdus sp.]
MAVGVGMDAIGLHVLPTFAHAREQAGHKSGVTAFRHLAIHLGEGLGIGRPVVGRQPDSEQQDAGAGVPRKVDHLLEVGPHGRQRLAAQAVIAAELDDHHRGPVLGQGVGEAGQATAGGVAPDAGVDDLVREAPIVQPLAQAVHPAVFHRHPVGGADAVAHDQDNGGGGCR